MILNLVNQSYMNKCNLFVDFDSFTPQIFILKRPAVFLHIHVSYHSVQLVNAAYTHK